MYRYPKFGKQKFHFAKALFFLVIATVIVLIMGGIVMLLWNAILPDTVGVKPLSYWQGVGLLALFRILFGGFRFGSRRDKGRRFRQRWKQKWEDKWLNMSEEERMKFKERWRDHCDRK